jgi:hypothetical protein
LLERRIVYGVDEKNFTRIKNLGISKFIVDYGEFLDMELLRGSKKKLLN